MLLEKAVDSSAIESVEGESILELRGEYGQGSVND